MGVFPESSGKFVPPTWHDLMKDEVGLACGKGEVQSGERRRENEEGGIDGNLQGRGRKKMREGGEGRGVERRENEGRGGGGRRRRDKREGRREVGVVEEEQERA